MIATAKPDVGDLNIRGVRRTLIQALKVEAIKQRRPLGDLVVSILEKWVLENNVIVPWEGKTAVGKSQYITSKG